MAEVRDGKGVKIIPFYLPQYHTIPLNDKCWGKGFTEWTNVRKAKPLFDGHDQPKIPLDNNYYNLLDNKTKKWQANIAKKYGIFGFCYYHYWFKNGQKLLEKPAEQMLADKNIDMPFCFCWANENWSKNWDGGNREIIMEQSYGEKDDWEQHFQYLLNFFKDERYQKRNNKPVFMIFDPLFQENKKMIEYLNKRCLDNGFAGICLIETCNSYEKDKIDELKSNTSQYTEFIHIREPSAAVEFLRKPLMHKVKNRIGKLINKILKAISKRPVYLEMFDGNKIFSIMKKRHFINDSIIRGLFFEWDNTPRHGNRGYIITPVSKKNFDTYMDTISDDEYVFLNAWNEWCEGMILEPTEENKFKYLEWIKEWKKNNENRINGI